MDKTSTAYVESDAQSSDMPNKNFGKDTVPVNIGTGNTISSRNVEIAYM